MGDTSGGTWQHLPAVEETLAEVAAIVRSLVGEGTMDELAYIAVGSPGFADGFARCVSAGAREVTVVPYFLSSGKHAAEDIPPLVESSMLRLPLTTRRIGPPRKNTRQAGGSHPRAGGRSNTGGGSQPIAEVRGPD